ncbi:MAG: TonB family protein [Terracidiphilus sp.]|nr:TonB family protein [Terracidiphilus sp.]
MFEDATFESMGTIHTRSRNWMVATFGLNGSIIAILIAIPFIYPSVLPQMMNAWRLEAPAPVEEAPPVVHLAPATAARNAYANPFEAPRRISQDIWVPRPGEDTDIGDRTVVDVSSMGAPGLDNPLRGQHVQTVVQASQPPRHISSGVMEGMLIRRVIPSYPPMARATRTAGRVELQATISRTGTIENLRVVSGSQLLVQAAIDAVTQWRYRPYLLNGEPVEVETTINVDFTLN